MHRANLRCIFHPSDFSEASEIAFAHALKIALVTGATLNMLHVDPGFEADWSDFPGVRSTLARWGLIPEGSPKSAVGELGIDVTKVLASSSNPVRECLRFLSRNPAELIVLAVHQHEGRMRWQQRRVGGPIAARAEEMTLFIPEGVHGFVARSDGCVSLQSILVPIAQEPRAQPAIDAVVRIIEALHLPPGTVTLLHVGPSSEAPTLTVPERTGWNWQISTQEGEPVEVILRIAADVSADLIVMTTGGRQGFLDALRGSTSERVLRAASCPVLSLPVKANRADRRN